MYRGGYFFPGHNVVPVVTTTTSTNLSSNKIQNGDILVLANADPPGIMAVKTDRDRQTDRQTDRQRVAV